MRYTMLLALLVGCGGDAAGLPGFNGDAGTDEGVPNHYAVLRLTGKWSPDVAQVKPGWIVVFINGGHEPVAPSHPEIHIVATDPAGLFESPDVAKDDEWRFQLPAALPPKIRFKDAVTGATGELLAQ